MPAPAGPGAGRPFVRSRCRPSSSPAPMPAGLPRPDAPRHLVLVRAVPTARSRCRSSPFTVLVPAVPLCGLGACQRLLRSWCRPSSSPAPMPAGLPRPDAPRHLVLVRAVPTARSRCRSSPFTVLVPAVPLCGLGACQRLLRSWCRPFPRMASMPAVILSGPDASRPSTPRRPSSPGPGAGRSPVRPRGPPASSAAPMPAVPPRPRRPRPVTPRPAAPAETGSTGCPGWRRRLRQLFGAERRGGG
ncbi:hypothetical protein FB563_2114 [Streptomyces puniciscabiei]|uniref:Uncharacterized protein n=1 Tax=Streptomyces puniciscabiei TaxID=164348 RepID=A0A542UDJ5_9ACTN|nr:hypothetical protein FB563_2114 [Streptomyces puniciscabiei]